MTVTTGMLIEGKMSTDMVRMDPMPRTAIRRARTTKVYGRRRASRTIHILARLCQFSAASSSSSDSPKAALLHARPPVELNSVLQSRINQGQICLRIQPFLHRYRIDGDHHFQRWRYIRIENVAAARCSICTRQHHVRVDDRFSLKERDVADHRNHFELTGNGNLLVHLAPGIKPPDCRSIHRSNSGEMRTGNVILLCKVLQSGKGLVSLTEDDRILLCLFSLAQQLNLHPRSCASCNGLRWRHIFACPRL